MNNQIEYDMPLGKSLKPNEQFSDMHVCTFCETKFNNMNSLNLHCQLHDNNKNFTCLMCKEVFFDLQQLKLHDLRHSIEEAHGDASNIENISFSGFISCNFCDEKFSSDEELINHCVVHPLKDAGIIDNENSGSEDLNCDSSESLSSDEEQLNYRILRQEIISPKNGRSHKQLIRLTLIDEHDVQVEEFTRMLKPKNIKKARKNSVKANNTQRKFKPKPNALKSHCNEKKQATGYLSDQTNAISKNIKSKINTSKENKQLKIDSSDNECQVIFDEIMNSSQKMERKSKLVAIKKKLWKDKIEIPTMRKVFSRAKNKFVYKCKKCRLVFDRLDNLNKHRAKDCSEPSLQVCLDCNKSFTNSNEFDKHCLTVHRKVTEFSCNNCNIEFTDKNLYRQHIMDYHCSSEKGQYDCRICNEHFVIACDLESHWKKHFNLKKFICCQCQRTFLKLSYFKVHKCSSEIICKMCNKIFSRISHLKRHLMSVHKMDKLKVESIVKKDSSVNSTSTNLMNGENLEVIPQSSPEAKLQSHNETNSAEDIICKICKKIFSRVYYLKRHLMNVHKLSKSKVDSIVKKYYSVNNISTNLMNGESLEDIPHSSPEAKLQSKEEKDRVKEDAICKICEKILSRVSHLKRHLMTVHGLDKSKVDSIVKKDSSENSISTNLNNNANLEDIPQSSPEAKLQSEEERDKAKEEESDIDGQLHKELVSNNFHETDLDENVNSKPTIEITIKKPPIKKEPNSKPNSKVSVKRNLKSSEIHHNYNSPAKKAKLKVTNSSRKLVNKKVLLKKTSVTNVKTKSKVSATKCSVPLKKKPVKKFTAKSSNKLSIKKTNKILNKSITPRKPSSEKKSMLKKDLVRKKRLENLKKNLGKKKVTKSK